MYRGCEDGDKSGGKSCCRELSKRAAISLPSDAVAITSSPRKVWGSHLILLVIFPEFIKPKTQERENLWLTLQDDCEDCYHLFSSNLHGNELMSLCMNPNKKYIHN